MNKEFKFFVVIVTYNRKRDLEDTLNAFQEQLDAFDMLIVVDNCSSDGTDQLLDAFAPKYAGKLAVEQLIRNSGGAGGFKAGLAKAIEYGADWIWLSDDDAIPAANCMYVVRSQLSSTKVPCVYGATAIEKDDDLEHLCWPVRIMQEGRYRNEAKKRADLHQIDTAEMLPFLGFTIHKSWLASAGLPNQHYFVSGDDREYSLRLRRAGASLYILRDAVVTHPKTPRYILSLFGRQILCLRLAPWRRFYDVRNRLWTARQTSGVLATLISLTIRMLASLYYEESKYEQLKAYTLGAYKGLFFPIPDRSDT
ncbi:MAG: hypothetical protein DRQ56_04810 [Gammaproteobacteria bacterium]|nr:MAG: hypothetical protein DRQ56_04810 [Gammaproteobacteria bacterium]